MAGYQLIETEQYQKIVFNGDITIDASMQFKDELKERLHAAAQKRFIVDMQAVPFMDSSGLGMLISMFKEVNELQGQIVYYGFQDYVLRLLKLVKLDQVFTIATDEAAAEAQLKNE